MEDGRRRRKAVLQEKKYFLFDIDGTLAVDDTLFDGSRELIEYINAVGGKSFYITNNSMKSRKDYVKKFARWGIETEESQFMTASYAACRYLAQNYQGKKLFVLGTPSFVEEVKSFGLKVTDQAEEDVACVVVGFDSTLDYPKVEKACQLLFRPEVDYIGTNPDLRCPTAYGFMPDCGAMCSLITDSTGVKPRFLGKPWKETVEMVAEITGYKPEEMAFVGDRLYTDVATGVNNGAKGFLVLTGEADMQTVAESDVEPTCIYDSLKEMRKYL